jgi:hypothetical protein
VLGAVPAESREAYSLAHELYGNARMLLAVLNRDQLQEVCLVGRLASAQQPASRVAACASGPTHLMPRPPPAV